MTPQMAAVEPRESEIQAAILAWLRSEHPELGARRIPMGGGRFGSRSRHSAGLPDIIGILPGGRLLAIEVKCPGAALRSNEAAQRAWLDLAARAGALVIVATCVADVEARVG